MSVSVPISADVNQVVAAIEKIRGAVRAAGQEGKAFADLDLSHPELAGMASELQEVQRRFEAVKQARGTSGAAVRKTGASDFLSWYENHEGAFAGSPQAAARHRENVGGYITSGTSFAPGGTPGAAAGAAPPPPAAPPGPMAAGDPLLPGGYGRGGTAAGDGGGGGIGGAYNMIKGALGALPAPIKFALGAAGIDSVGRLAGRATGQAEDEAIGDDKLMRHLDGLGTDFGTLRKAVRQTADGLHITYGETERLASLYSRLSGSTNAGDVLDQTRFAAGAARGYGIDAGAFVSASARMAQGGVDPKEFAGLLGDTIRDGMTGGQVEQTMSSLVRWTETANRTLIDHSNVADFGAALGLLNSTQLPGLRGENGANILGQVDNAVRQGGAGGAASQALTYRAMRGAGITNPFDVEYRLEGGMFERGPKGGPSNFSLLYDEFNKEYRGVDPSQRRSAGARMFGVNQHQFDALEAAHLSGANPGQGMSFLSEHGIGLDSLNPNSLNEVFQVLHASDGNLEGWRSKLAGRADTASGAAGLVGKSGDELREGLVRLLGSKGMTSTMGSQAQDSINAFSNSLTQAGTGLLPTMALLRDGVSALTQEFVGPLSTAIGDFTQWVKDQTGAKVEDLLTADPANPDAPAPGRNGKRGGGFGGFLGNLVGMGSGDMSKNATDAQIGAGKRMGAYLESLGLDPAHAAAIVGRAQLESGFNAQASVIDTDGLRHRGLLQLSPDRQANFKGWAGHDITQSTWQEQMGFAVFEMTGGDEKGKAGPFWSARTARDAGSHYSADIIRPGHRINEAATTASTADGWEHLLPDGTTAASPAGQAGGGQQVQVVGQVTVNVQHPNGRVTTHQAPLTQGAPARPYGAPPPVSPDRSLAAGTSP